MLGLQHMLETGPVASSHSAPQSKAVIKLRISISSARAQADER